MNLPGPLGVIFSISGLIVVLSLLVIFLVMFYLKEEDDIFGVNPKNVIYGIVGGIGGLHLIRAIFGSMAGTKSFFC